MDKVNLINIASELVNEGASKECLRVFLCAPYHMSKQIALTRKNSKTRSRVRLGSRFLQDKGNCYQAALFLSILECSFDKEEIGNPGSIRANKNFISSYRIYREVSKRPLSINECAGVVTFMRHGRYKRKQCEKLDIQYLGDPLYEGNPFIRSKKQQAAYDYK